MFIFFGLVEYWEQNGLPIARIFRESPTFLSEESGELAISLLSRSRPANLRCDYENTRKSWLLVKQMNSAASDGQKDAKRPESKKSHRTIGYSSLLNLYLRWKTM